MKIFPDPSDQVRWLRRPWIYNLALDSLVIAVWLTSVGMVVVHEHGRLWGGGMKPFASIRDSMEIQEQWFGIYYGDQKVGFANTRMMPNERDGIPGISIWDQGRLYFTLLGFPQRIEISARTFIDADFRLQAFTATIQTEDYDLEWSGHRDGDEIVMTLTSEESTVTRRIRDPAGNTMVSGLSSWMSFHEFRTGHWGEVWMLNPLSLSTEIVHYTVRRREQLNGEEVLVVETDVRGISTMSWVTPDGRVLKEESPMGWMLLAEPRQLAMKLPSGDASTLDLLSTTAVPIDQPLDDPVGLSHLVLLLEGAGPDDMTVERPWQTVLPADALVTYQRTAPSGPWCLLEMRRPLIPDPTTATSEVAVRYQRASPFIQADDERIRRKALEIVGGLTDPWQQTVALNRWVYTALAKKLTVGLPTAVDVLRSLAGDCHEHTVLFTALSRSLGIPTRAVAGLVYYNGQLFYHAWPEVWLGTWIPTDPTLGQLVADVTHVGLVEAENEALIGLAQFVGRLRISVLDTGRGPEAGSDSGPEAGVR